MLLKETELSIEPGKDYLLDDKTVVRVIKPINRAKTVFSVEIAERGIETVEKIRLKELEKEVD